MPRGIYHVRGTGADGERNFVAIDSRGKDRFRAVVYPGEDLAAAERALWEMLDRFDPPRRHLFLMK